ncbi:MAG: dipeptidase [Candidatus Puniceispirillales bacterium]
MQQIFDGHNDVLLRLWLAGDVEGQSFFSGNPDTHIDWPRARKGGLAGGFFAIFTPPPGKALLSTAGVDLAHAARATAAMISIFDHLCDHHPERFRRCLNAAEAEAAMADGVMAAILHIEGAEAIDASLDNLEGLYQQGLRSLGPVWSRSNVFGHGVPFDFPGSPDQLPGLTDAGKALVRACDEMGIMLDCSHLNEAGFRDIAAISTRPLVATHSNSHMLCPSPRNLTDAQLAMIAESGGMVGINFASGFLRDDGRKTADTTLDIMLAHLDHLISHLGEGHIGLGSDFDGAIIPSAIGDCAGLPRLVQAMRDHGFGDDLIDRICRRNWLDQIKVQIG